MARCSSRAVAKQWLGAGSISLQCHLDETHSGKHEAFGQPFPGFANEAVRWDDADADTEQSIGVVGELEDDLRKLGEQS
jgi:hypothetical protein